VRPPLLISFNLTDDESFIKILILTLTHGVIAFTAARHHPHRLCHPVPPSDMEMESVAMGPRGAWWEYCLMSRTVRKVR
jgi:hypothetical protein